MSIGEIRERCIGIINGLFWEGDVNYSPFEKAYQEALDEIDKLIEQIKEDTTNDRSRTEQN